MKSPAQQIRELSNRLEKIAEAKPDAFPWDDEDDDADLGTGFSKESMFDQLGKVLDSAGNPNPVKTVTTDDGKEFTVSADQAKMLRMFATTDKVKPNVRAQFIKDIQRSDTLHQFLDIKDYHSMGNLFITKYLG